MKKFVFLLISLLLVCSMSMAMAETTVTAKPGDTLTLDVVLTSGGGETASVGIKTNDAPITYISASGCGPNDVVPPNGDNGFNGKFTLWNLDGVTLSSDGSVLSGSLDSYTIQTLVAGQIGTLTFKVNDDAAAGTYTVEAYVAVGSVAVDSKITFTIEEQVSERVPGDVNEDGKVNSVDAQLTMKYAAKWDVAINLSNADVNADGKVNSADAQLIMKYAAKWDVELK